MMDQERHSTSVNYGALYLMASRTFFSIPMLWTMLVNNVGGSYKIGYALAVEVGMGNIGGIASSLIFPGSQAPK